MCPTKAECADIPCAEALERPRRMGRASYVCPLCGRDVSLAVILLAQAMAEADTPDDA